MSSNEQRRLEAERANKESIARELEKQKDAASRREAERKRQEAKGLSDELKHSRGRDPGRNRS